MPVLRLQVGGQFGAVLRGGPVLLTQRPVPALQGPPKHLLRLLEPPLVAEGGGRVAVSGRRPGMLLAERSAVNRQRLAIERFGIRVATLVVQVGGDVVITKGGFQVVRTEQGTVGFQALS